MGTPTAIRCGLVDTAPELYLGGYPSDRRDWSRLEMRGWIAARGAVWAAPIVLEDEASEWNAKRAEQARISYRQYRSNRAAVIAAASDCAICRQPLTLADPAEADHIVPRSQGGQHSFENLRAVHRGCNLARGDKPV